MAEVPDIGFEEIWAFYERSGFLYANKKDLLQPYLDEISGTWSKLLASQNRIFGFFFQRRGTEITSSTSTVRESEHTWIVQHTAGFRDAAGVRDSMVEMGKWLLEIPDCKFSRLLYRPSNKWPALFFGGLMERLRKDAFEHRILGYYSGAFDNPLEVQESSSAGIIYPDPNDLEELECQLEIHRSRFFIDSRSLRPEQVELPDTVARFHEAGLERERKILVAKGDRGLIGYSVLDYASVGINFSHFLSSFQLEMFEEDEIAEASLVAASVNHYLERGQRWIVGMSQKPNDRLMESLGMYRQKDYGELTISRANDGFASCGPYFSSFYGSGSRR